MQHPCHKPRKSYGFLCQIRQGKGIPNQGLTNRAVILDEGCTPEERMTSWAKFAATGKFDPETRQFLPGTQEPRIEKKGRCGRK
jgi:hypothetical protein